MKNDKDVRKNIYDYYKMLMQLEIDIDSGKVKMDEKFEQDKLRHLLHKAIPNSHCKQNSFWPFF